MKKALILFTTFFLCLAAQAEKKQRIIDFEALPAKAQEFVLTYFAEEPIRFVRMENEVTRTEYTVRFENGMEIEFNGSGDWDEVESHSACLPNGFLHEGILRFLDENHTGYCLHEVAKGRHKFEVELSDGTELIFNKSGEFLRYDD